MPKITKYFTDIIACIKVEDFYFFFSFEEMYQNKTFNISKFINPGISEIEFDRETEIFLERNEFIRRGGMFSGDSIVPKKSLYDFFHLGYTEPSVLERVLDSSTSYRRTVEGIFRYLNGKDTSLGATNFLSDTNFSYMNEYGNPKNIFYLRVLENGFIYPADVESFSSGVASVKSKYFSDFNLKTTDLPRITNFGLLNIIFTQVGPRQMEAGQLCYNIISQDEVIYLEKNIAINEENIVTNISANHFYDINKYARPNSGCEPDNFRVGDTIIGMMDNGIFVPVDRTLIKKLDNKEKSLLRLYSENIRSKQTINEVNYLYPKQSLYLLTSRPRNDYPYEEKSFDYTVFTNAFYNLVSFYKPSGRGIISLNTILSKLGRAEEITYFRLEVIKEFLRYIHNNYVLTGMLENRYYPNDEKMLEFLDFIQDSIDPKSRLVSRGGEIDKEYFIYIVTNITGISDPNYALVEFLSSSGILYGDYKDQEYPYLRSISFFVTCDKDSSCDSLTTFSELDTENITFPILIGQSYEVYYNIRTETFVNYPL